MRTEIALLDEPQQGCMLLDVAWCTPAGASVMQRTVQSLGGTSPAAICDPALSPRGLQGNCSQVMGDEQ